MLKKRKIVRINSIKKYFYDKLSRNKLFIFLKENNALAEFIRIANIHFYIRRYYDANNAIPDDINKYEVYTPISTANVSIYRKADSIVELFKILENDLGAISKCLSWRHYNNCNEHIPWRVLYDRWINLNS